MLLELAPHIPPNSFQKSPRQQHSATTARKHWNPVCRRPSPRIHNSQFTCKGSAPSAPPLPLPAPQKETVTYIESLHLQPISESISFGSSALTRVLRALAPSTLGAGRLIAMAGAMKTFWVLLLVVAMAALAAQAHDGVDHGPAGAPHAEAPDMGSAAELLASWLSPLLLAGAAFAASVLRS